MPIARCNSAYSYPCLFNQKPFFQWVLNTAMIIAPKIPAAPRGVRKPDATEMPPPNSPRIARLAQNHAGLKPCARSACVIFVKPGPPDQGTSFCNPCAAIVSPATRRRTSKPRLSEIAIYHVPFQPESQGRMPLSCRFLEKRYRYHQLPCVHLFPFRN